MRKGFLLFVSRILGINIYFEQKVEEVVEVREVVRTMLNIVGIEVSEIVSERSLTGSTGEEHNNYIMNVLYRKIMNELKNHVTILRIRNSRSYGETEVRMKLSVVKMETADVRSIDASEV